MILNRLLCLSEGLLWKMDDNLIFFRSHLSEVGGGSSLQPMLSNFTRVHLGVSPSESTLPGTWHALAIRNSKFLVTKIFFSSPGASVFSMLDLICPEFLSLSLKSL